MIECCQAIPDGLCFGRGFTGQACRIVKQNGGQVHIEDRRRALPEVDLTFGGKLKPFQQEALGPDYC